jgi:hypothetical protein
MFTIDQTIVTKLETEKAEQDRRSAYIKEADPLFFKVQRGEALEQEWLDKIAEIKAKYPKPE